MVESTARLFKILNTKQNT